MKTRADISNWLGMDRHSQNIPMAESHQIVYRDFLDYVQSLGYAHQKVTTYAGNERRQPMLSTFTWKGEKRKYRANAHIYFYNPSCPVAGREMRLVIESHSSNLGEYINCFVGLNLMPGEEGLDEEQAQFSKRKNAEDFLDNLVERFEAHQHEFGLLKNAKFSATFEELKLKGRTFDDIILTDTKRHLLEDNIFTILEHSDRLIERGVETNRGIMLAGPPGVGKTELAKATADFLNLPIIRLQCYEGLDESKALYEWQYGKQLLYTQVLKEKLGDLMDGAKTLDQSMQRLDDFEDVFFSEQFLQTRPLLQALRSESGTVLLIDEIDKSDDEFEAFLLEILSDYQISVPELGTFKAKTPPLVFLTSNNTREIGDALKRRCLHLYIDFPDAARENAILQARVPQLDTVLREKVVAFVQGIRQMDLKKPPAVSETIDWARTLVLLNVQTLDSAFVQDTLNVLLKFKSDIENVESDVTRMLREINSVAAN